MNVQYRNSSSIGGVLSLTIANQHFFLQQPDREHWTRPKQEGPRPSLVITAPDLNQVSHTPNCSKGRGKEEKGLSMRDRSSYQSSGFGVVLFRVDRYTIEGEH